MFAAVDSDDENGAQLRATGTWVGTEQNINLHFDTVEELGPGKRRLPLKARYIYDAVGAALGRLCYCGISRDGFTLHVPLGIKDSPGKDKKYVFERL